MWWEIFALPCEVGLVQALVSTLPSDQLHALVAPCRAKFPLLRARRLYLPSTTTTILDTYLMVYLRAASSRDAAGMCEAALAGKLATH